MSLMVKFLLCVPKTSHSPLDGRLSIVQAPRFISVQVLGRYVTRLLSSISLFTSAAESVVAWRVVALMYTCSYLSLLTGGRHLLQRGRSLSYLLLCISRNSRLSNTCDSTASCIASHRTEVNIRLQLLLPTRQSLRLNLVSVVSHGVGNA